MTIKEFLKPTISKIVITVALFALFILAPIYPHRECMTVVGGGCKTFYSSFIAYPLHAQSQIVMAIFAAFLVIAYLLSCTISFAYNKLKR